MARKFRSFSSVVGTSAVAAAAAVACVAGGRSSLDGAGACESRDAGCSTGARRGASGTSGTGGLSGPGGFGNVGGDGGFGGFGGAGGFGNVGGDGGFGGFGGAGGAFFDAGLSCTPSVPGQEITQIELLFLVDRSLAMGCPIGSSSLTPLVAVNSAIEVAVETTPYPYLAVGLEFFGRDPGDGGFSCDGTRYETPDVDFSAASDVLPPLIAAAAVDHPAAGGAPLLPALEGALFHAVQPAFGPFNRRAVVLVTGTEETSCTTPSDLRTVAAIGMGDGVPTNVIEIPTPGPDCTESGDAGTADGLDAIADAGGSSAPIVVERTTHLESDVEAAIASIVQRYEPVVPCSYAMPVLPQGPPLDLGRLNIYRWDTSGVSHVVANVGDPSRCNTGSGGWYYDPSENPTDMLLCPATCASVQASFAGVSITLGCPTFAPDD